MRVLIVTVALMGAAATPALGAAESQTCARGSDVRTIEVLAPGKVGKACDLRVVRDNGAHISTPYHANQSAGFCAARATDIVAGLAREGFACGPTPATVAASAPPPAPSPEAAIEAAAIPAAEPAPTASSNDPMEALIAKSTAPVAPAPTPVEASAVSPEMGSTAEIAPSVAAAPAPLAVEAPAAIASANPAPTNQAAAQTLEQPPLGQPEADIESPKLASAGPVALSPTNASALVGVRAPRPAAGRLVGAAADAKPLDAVDEDVAEERLGPTQAAPTPVAPTGAPTAAPTAVPATAPAAAPIAKADQAPSAPAGALPSAPKARAADDIIRAVLAARTAAWNDGDLDAFMGGYWKDPELRFIRSGTVFKGWKETMGHLRGHYGEGPTMGRLALDNLDIDLVEDDVATVAGRYRIARAGVTEVGTFTLVMKRFDGLWRIVQEHSTPETPRTN